MFGGDCRALLAVVLAAVAMPARADDYPSRPITIIVPFPPGGSSDIVMRLVAQQGCREHQAAYHHREPPGRRRQCRGDGDQERAAGRLSADDGPHRHPRHQRRRSTRDLKFDPVKDFQPITALISFNNILVVPGASPAKSVAELVAFAKTRPEGLSYGSQGVGTGGHLLGVLLAKQAGIKLVHVPYRGIAPAVTDTVAGRMDMLFASYLSHRAARRRPAGFACWRSRARERHPRIPDVPTMAEAGFPGSPDAAMVRPVRAGRHAGADRAASSTPNSSRRCRATR